MPVRNTAHFRNHKQDDHFDHRGCDKKKTGLAGSALINKFYYLHRLLNRNGAIEHGWRIVTQNTVNQSISNDDSLRYRVSGEMLSENSAGNSLFENNSKVEIFSN